VKGFGWNHKRVYRIDRELELNLRIKPKKRLAREEPQPLQVPAGINEVWSMDDYHERPNVALGSIMPMRRLAGAASLHFLATANCWGIATSRPGRDVLRGVLCAMPV